MPIYCKSCGRAAPDDANMCPYCSALIVRSQGVQSNEPTYPPEQKKDKTLLIVLIVVVIVVVALISAIALTIFFAASVYEQVSSELPDIEDINILSTPTVSLVAEPGSGSNSNDVTITCGTCTDPDVSWYSVTYTLIDLNEYQQLVEYSDYQVTNSLFGTISGGDTIEITGLNGELEENHEYRITLTYDNTGGIMGTVTWTQ